MQVTAIEVTKKVRAVTLWNPDNDKTKVGRLHKTFLDQLKDNVYLDIDDMTNSMKDRDVW